MEVNVHDGAAAVELHRRRTIERAISFRRVRKASPSVYNALARAGVKTSLSAA